MSNYNFESSLDKAMLNDCKHDGNRSFQRKELDFDVVVVGAGLAGICAALAAARAGAKTALISDRPILGGSTSSEIRVMPIGAANPSWNLFARETGILEEIMLNISEKGDRMAPRQWHLIDEAYFDVVLAEPNLEIFLNTSVYDLAVENKKIKQVTAVQLRSEKIITFNSEMFIDCSGDGVIAYLSGADYRVGREAREEFNESDAPEKSDRGTMGATLLFTSVDRGHDVNFKAPKWAIDVKALPTLIDPEKMINRQFYRGINGNYYGFWWAEYGGQIDSIHDDDKVIMHTRKLIYGLWDYVKNSGKFANVEHQDIDWIGYMPGKRESRRILGPVIVTGNHLLEQYEFEDKIGYTGWTIDTHPPCGYMDSMPGSKHTDLPAVSDIPLRALFSRNIENLWFAGRNISASREGLGSLRVIATGGVMGQAAGEAAAYAFKNKLTPRQVADKHVNDIQHMLVRNDQSITGYRLLEDDNLSRGAKISASSERQVTAPVEHYFSLTERLCLMLPVNKQQLKKISFYAKVFRETELILHVYATDEPQNYRFRNFIGTYKQKITSDGWVEFDIDAFPGNGLKLFFILEKNQAVAIGYANETFPGILGMRVEDDEIINDITRYHNLSFIPAFCSEPELDLFSAQNLSNGYIRPYGLPHCWSSNAIDIAKPAELTITFNELKRISNIELVFDSNLNNRHVMMFDRFCIELCRDYDIFAVRGRKKTLLIQERDNIQRFRRHEFEAVMADKIELKIYRTWGSKYAAVYDFRIY